MFLEQQAVSGHFRDGLVGVAFPGLWETKGSAMPMKTRQSREEHSIQGRMACCPWRGDNSREHNGVDTEAGGSSHQQGHRAFPSFPALRFHPMSGPFVTPPKRHFPFNPDFFGLVRQAQGFLGSCLQEASPG